MESEQKSIEMYSAQSLEVIHITIEQNILHASIVGAPLLICLEKFGKINYSI